MFLRLHACFLGVCLVVSPDAFSQDSLSKVFNVETSQMEGIPCHEWYSVLLGSTQLFVLVWTRWEPGSPSFSRYEVDLTTSEFVSEYYEENPNIVWSGRKQLETHEYINEPLDQVKPDSCFQSSDEGPSLFFFWLCVDLNQSWTVDNLVLSSFIPRVLRTCHIFIGSRLRALGCEQNQSFWNHGVTFMVC